MYPRLRPPQRGQTNPFGHRCAVRCSPHRTSSPKRERNSLTVMMDFRFNRLGFFISDILSPFVRLFKLDIHLILLAQVLLAVTVIAAPGQAQTPVGWWKFDDGSGPKAADSSGNGHTATLVDGVGWVTGKIGEAVSANAARRQYVSIPPINLSGTQAVTVALWAKRTYSTAGGHALFEAGTNYTNSITGFGFFPDDDTCAGIQAT